MEAYYLKQAQDTVEHLWTRLTREEVDGATGREWPDGRARARRVAVQVDGLTISGELDVFESNGAQEGGIAPRNSSRVTHPDSEGSATVVRYHLSRSDSSPGLRDLFTVAAAEAMAANGAAGSAIARNLTNGVAAPVKLSARQRARLTREALDAAAGITRHVFPTKPDEWQCKRCPFAASCPE
jgi:CRISPR/Cas system-associated exonuclease Cas4 (RecB family)